MSPDDAFIDSLPNSFSWNAQKGFIEQTYFIVLLTLYVGSSVGIRRVFCLPLFNFYGKVGSVNWITGG